MQQSSAGQPKKVLLQNCNNTLPKKSKPQHSGFDSTLKELRRDIVASAFLFAVLLIGAAVVHLVWL
jgi:hypothetical protein